jgi:predicted TIM-barrel fold metal-dependent hydrolase
MGTIDCHANIGWDTNNIRKNYFPSQQKYTELLFKMNTHLISKAIVLPFPSPAGQFDSKSFWYDLENHYLMQAVNFSKKFIPFPAVNPNDEKSVNYIQTMATTFKIKGIKISHQIPMGFSINNLINHPLMKIVRENNLLVMVHTGTGKEAGSAKFHETLDYGIKVASKYPHIKFIFCHLGRLHKCIINALELKNVYMDTSAVSMISHSSEFSALDFFELFKRDTPEQIIKKLVDFGYEDKLIFGSDEPYAFYKEEIKAINNANISVSAKNKILFGNISDLLGINNGGENEHKRG